MKYKVIQIFSRNIKQNFPNKNLEQLQTFENFHV